MAIEKLQHWYNTWDRSSSWPSGTDIINKINEIIDYINSKYQFSDNSGKVEKEPNKVELVPLDDWIDQAIEDIVKTYNRTMNEEYRSRIRKSIEKYLPEPKLTLKKFTEWVVWERLVKSGRISHEDSAAERYWVDMLYAFLEEKWMLEE